MDLQPHIDGTTRRVAEVEKKRVLVIDDDLPIRGMLGAALRQQGFQVLLAGDGAEGHRALALHHPDIVLLDLAMPDVNGWDFLQKLQESGHLGKVQVVVVSAHVLVDPQALLQMGVVAILPKPFNLPELLSLIEHLAA
ncbi:MAG: response regulator [Thermoanaerobaculia bacterium]